MVRFDRMRTAEFLQIQIYSSSTLLMIFIKTGSLLDGNVSLCFYDEIQTPPTSLQNSNDRRQMIRVTNRIHHFHLMKMMNDPVSVRRVIKKTKNGIIHQKRDHSSEIPTTEMYRVYVDNKRTSTSSNIVADNKDLHLLHSVVADNKDLHLLLRRRGHS